MEQQGQPRISFQVDVVDANRFQEPRRTSRRRSSIRSILEPTKAIDKGWSWVVVAASFVLTFMLVGVFSSFGVIYVPLVILYSGQNQSSDSCSANATLSSVSGQTGRKRSNI